MKGGERMKTHFLSALLVLLTGTALTASANESVYGYWVVPGGDAVVEVTRSDVDSRIRLVALLDPNTQDSANPDASLRGRPLKGVVIGAGFDGPPDQLGGGWIYDPDSGRTYKAELSLRHDLGDSFLQVRGYLGLKLLGRTQVWRRLSLYSAQVEQMLEEVGHVR